MTGTPIDIIGLASLASGAARSLARGIAPGNSSFADALGRAQTDLASSGLPVGLARGVDVELTSDQLQRLAAAADRAEAQGAQTAVVMIDGRALELDVTLRQITGEVSPDQGIRPEIDTFLFAPPAAETAAGPGSGNPSNTDLLRLLADRDDGDRVDA